MAVVTLSTVPQPPLWYDVPSVTLNDDTLRQRKAGFHRLIGQRKPRGVNHTIFQPRVACQLQVLVTQYQHRLTVPMHYQ